MFEKLKSRWGVNGMNLILIILTFAMGGSACAKVGAWCLKLLGVEKGVFWMVLYVVLVTLLWPICVLLISIPLFQFGFFKRYLQKIGKRFFGKKKHEPIRIALFASGNGTNAENIICHFKNNSKILVVSVLSDNPKACVIQKAQKNGIPFELIPRERINDAEYLIRCLEKQDIRLIVLAGYLKKIPQGVIARFPNKIINIHPALLPAYGGKGMYGMKVHRAVIENHEKYSGITIHYVNEHYDEGEIIFQSSIELSPDETPESLAEKIHKEEHNHFPRVIESVIHSKQFVN